MWIYEHPANPKVGDEVRIIPIEVPDEDVEMLDGLQWPSGLPAGIG